MEFLKRENQLADYDLHIGDSARCHLARARLSEADHTERSSLDKEKDVYISPEEKRRFYNSVRDFFSAVMSKIVKKMPVKSELLQGLSFLNPSNRLDISPATIKKLVAHFPENVVPQSSGDKLHEELIAYQLADDHELPQFKPGQTRMDSFWGELSTVVTSDGKPKYPLLTKLAKAALVLPHSNADSERAFSIVGKIRTQFRSEMCQDTLCALLSCKMNTNGKASDYHPSKEVLAAAKSAAYKYNKKHTNSSA